VQSLGILAEVASSCSWATVASIGTIWLSLFGANEVWMSLARWMQMLGIFRMGRSMCTNLCTKPFSPCKRRCEGEREGKRKGKSDRGVRFPPFLQSFER